MTQSNPPELQNTGSNNAPLDTAHLDTAPLDTARLAAAHLDTTPSDEPASSDRGWFSGLGPNVKALGAVSLLNDASSEIIYPLLPFFLTRILGASLGMVGLVEGLAETTASLLKLYSGWLSDRLGRRKGLTLFGYGLASFTRPLLALATAPWQVLVLRFTDRVGKGIRTSPRDALIAASVSPLTRGKAFGFHRAMDHLGAAIGPLFAFWYLTGRPEDYRGLFWWAALPAIISLLVLWLMVKDKPIASSATLPSVPPSDSPPGPPSVSPSFPPSALPSVSPSVPPSTLQSAPPSAPPPSFSLRPFPASFKLVLLAFLVFTLGNSSDAFLLLRANQLGVAEHYIPLLWVFLHVVKWLTSMPGGMLSDRIGRSRTILIGWAVYALVYLGLALAGVQWQIWALFVVYGFYFGLTEGVERALVADLVPESMRGTAYGLFHLTIGITALPASVIMGVLWQKVGVVAAFGLGSGLAALAGLILLAALPARRSNLTP